MYDLALAQSVCSMYDLAPAQSVLTSSVAALLAGMVRMWCMAVLGFTASHRPSDARTMRAPFSGSVTWRTSGSAVTAAPACAP